METLLGRYKNLIILVAALFIQAFGLAVQVKRANDPQQTRLIRVWAVNAITPFERVIVWAENSTTNIWHNYFYLRGVRAENRQLKEQIDQMRLEQVRLNEDAAQARRLQALLGFKEQFISKTVAAQVIGTSGTDAYQVYIDKGENAGVKRDMAVITADGVVGKVTLVYPSVSEVVLINDLNSGVGVILEKSRLQGVIRGTGNGEVMLDHVMSGETVPAGETVLTSGGDQIFPKGLPVGTIGKVTDGKDLFLNIKIKPTANLSKLEEVLVVVEKQERQPGASGISMRAADVLSQRLPSVPDKPADAGTKTAPATAASLNVNPANAPKPQAKTDAKPSGTAAAAATTAATKTPAAANGAAGTSQSHPASSAANTAGQNNAVQSNAAPNSGLTNNGAAKPVASAPAKPAPKPVTTQPKPAGNTDSITPQQSDAQTPAGQPAIQDSPN